MIEIAVQAEDFDLAQEAAALRAARRDIGALVTFTGLVRDMNEGVPLAAMTLEHYPAMTASQLRAIADEAESRWPVLGGRIIHRFGRLLPGDQIVLVAIAAEHRQGAFEAAAFLMDWLKTRAPFWKLEEGDGTRRWVAARCSDNAAAARWAAPER